MVDAPDPIGHALASLDATTVALADASGLFERLDPTSASREQLCADLGWSTRGGDALLTALVALKLLQRSRGRFALTDRGRQRWQVAAGFAHNPRDEMLAWQGASLRTGLPLLPERCQAWADGRALPDAADAAQRMHALMAGPAQQLAQQPTFGRARRLLDVAGGLGTNLMALAQRWPRLQLGLFELPEVVDLAIETLTRAGLRQRTTWYAGNMFEDALPAGHDVHLWSNVFHDWPFERCALLARRSFEALPPGGRIALHELLLDDDRCGPVKAALFSLMMLFTTQGQQFSGAELRALLREVGFVRPRVVRCGDYSLVTAIRP